MGVPAADNLRSPSYCGTDHCETERAAAADLIDAIAALHQTRWRTQATSDARPISLCSCGLSDCPTARLLQGEGE